MNNKNLLSWIGIKSAQVFLVHGAGVVLLFLMHSIISRVIGAYEYGVFSHSFATFQMISSIAVLGWPTAMMRFAAEYRSGRKWGLLRGVFIRGYQIATIAAVMVGGLLWLISFLPHTPPEVRISFRYAGLLVPLTGLILMSRRALRGLNVILPSITPPELILPLIVCGVVFGTQINTGGQALLVYFGASAVTLAWLSFYVRHYMPQEAKEAQPEFNTRFWSITAIPMLFVNMTQMVMTRIDIIMLGFLTEMTMVGFYSAANRISMIALFVKSAIFTVVAPMFAATYQNGRKERFFHILFLSVLISVTASVPMVAVLMIRPDWALIFFGREFVEGASTTLVILLLARLLDIAGGPAGSALLLSGRERQVLYINFPIMLFKILLNYLAIEQWGMVGAAWASLISIALINLLYWPPLLREYFQLSRRNPDVAS